MSRAGGESGAEEVAAFLKGLDDPRKPLVQADQAPALTAIIRQWVAGM